MKKILVIDGNSIINRAYYGVRLLTNKSGKFTNAIYGTVSIISKQLEAINPDYCAVAFDVKHPTFRHEMYPEYKAGRHPTPEELLSQFDDTKECLSLMGIKVLELPGWEADDLQGTIASLANGNEDLHSYILSGDRDLLQLITENITVLLATNSDTVPFTAVEFREKYGIEPELFVDMKALMGDSSDNIPGVAGVGEKTAQTLISSFGTLEEIYDNIDDKRITKGVREKLLRDRDNAFLSRRLARIDIHAPIDVTLEDISYTGFDKGGLYRKFSELELKSFITKFHLEPSSDDVVSPTSESASFDFKAIESTDLCKQSNTFFALEWKENEMYISLEEGDFLYTGAPKDVKPFLEGSKILCYGGKTLYHRLLHSEIDVRTINFCDLELYEYLLNPGSGQAGISSLCSMFLGKTPTGKSATPLMRELEHALSEKLSEYGMLDLLNQVELPLMKILAEMEETGFKINPQGIDAFGEALEELANDLSARIYMQAGEVFNINSPKQLGEVLYERMGLVGQKKKGKTGYSTDAEALEGLRDQSPIIDDILEYRQVTKLRGTYTTALTEVADDEARIHTDFKQALTATGRLSSADPNLQNIPIKTKMGRELRRFFIAEEGYTLVDADYSQIELRLLAHISGDYNMSEAFRCGEDIHRKTAAAVFGIPEEMVTEEMRKRAKAVNFGIVYGISGFSLSKDIGTTVSEASKYIKSYLLNYLDVDRYLEAVVKEAEANGYTTTIMGRRRYIPELRASQAPIRAFGKRVAMNAPIQGSAADIMKLAMIRVYDRLRKEGLDARLVMQVHDEIIVEVKDEQVELCMKAIKEEMESVIELSVPLTVDITYGKNWLEQK